MAGLLTALGGAVAGIGQGLAQQAEEDGRARREARLLELQHGYRMDEMGAQQRFQTGERTATQDFTTQRDTARFGHEKDMASLNHGYRIGEIGASGANTQANTRLSYELQGKQGEVRFGQEKDLAGIKHGYDIENKNLDSANKIAEKKAEISARADLGGLTDNQKNVVGALKDMYGYDTVAIRRALLATKDPALRALAQGGEEGSAPDAPKKPGLFERIFGGSPDAPAAPTPASPPVAVQVPQAATPPSGKGTQAEPFQATTQADIEWFKSSAPKGAVIVVNGKPFTK